ncbi:DUF1353 domain-containing protein [Streptomyces phaeochromogenes]|uniref:DUF1353 domain-containing protein n=1 Tax=Streptomyces phaeochromogenes TaxID=1923 RepID=UPI00367EC40B
MAASNSNGPVTQQPRLFYDGGVDASSGRRVEPANRGADALIQLERVTADDGREYFKMQRRIAYCDERLGELLVPLETGSFTTDLTSVPALFTWLVPKTGEHLPATLLHDGLSHPVGAPEYSSTNNVVVKRAEADRVLRDALRDAGTGLIRRWLIWSAVAMVTMLQCSGTGWPAWLQWWYRVFVSLTGLGILVLGIWASLDLFDAEISWLPNLPWMGDRQWWVELVGGLSAAVVLPVGASLFWWPFWKAGAVAGVSLAVLLHVTVALLLISAMYQVMERFRKKWPKTAGALAGLGMVAALGGFVWVLVTR